MTMTFKDTARGRLIDHAAARIRADIVESHLPHERASLRDTGKVWHYIDDSARALTAGGRDMELEIYYGRDLGNQASNNLIRDTINRALEFLTYPTIEQGETVFKIAATSTAKGLLRVEAVEGWLLFCIGLDGESHALQRHEVKRPYNLGQTVYFRKTGATAVIERLEDEGLWVRAAGVTSAARGAIYADIEPTAADGLSGDLHPVSLMRPFLHPSKGWQLGIHIGLEHIMIDGQKVSLTTAHKSILRRLKSGMANRTALSVAAHNHPKLLGGLAAVDIWRRQELRQLVAGGLVEAISATHCVHCFQLTAAGRLVAATLPDLPNPLRKPRYPDKERAADVTIYGGDNTSIVIRRVAYNPDVDTVLTATQHTYQDKRLTASSRKRLMHLLWRHNWQYEREEGLQAYTVDWYRLDP